MDELKDERPIDLGELSADAVGSPRSPGRHFAPVLTVIALVLTLAMIVVGVVRIGSSDPSDASLGPDAVEETEAGPADLDEMPKAVAHVVEEGGFAVLDLPEALGGPSIPAPRFEAIWPEVSAQELAASQAKVDDGAEAWRRRARATAEVFAKRVLGWSEMNVESSVVRFGGGSAQVALTDGGWSGAEGYHGEAPVTLVGLARLGAPGPGGIWSIFELDSDLITLDRVWRHSSVPGRASLSVSGTVNASHDGFLGHQHVRVRLYQRLAGGPERAAPWRGWPDGYLMLESPPQPSGFRQSGELKVPYDRSLVVLVFLRNPNDSTIVAADGFAIGFAPNDRDQP